MGEELDEDDDEDVKDKDIDDDDDEKAEGKLPEEPQKIKFKSCKLE